MFEVIAAATRLPMISCAERCGTPRPIKNSISVVASR
jgi:hypothetical protein